MDCRDTLRRPAEGHRCDPTPRPARCAPRDPTPSRRRRRLLGAATLLLLAFPSVAPAAEPADFASRLETSLRSGPVAQDRLWRAGARDESRRLLDVRTAALFAWSDVHVEPRGTRPLPPAPSGAPRLAAELFMTGTASWHAAAWGVAQAFWTLQTDERAESNRVVRREEWALERDGEKWLAVERRPLGLLEILEARLIVDVYPGQDAFLVEGSYYVRSVEDGVRAVRFLLDRRSAAYDFRVNGQLAPVVRGNELGSLGLAGLSPESESSFEFPVPLDRGEEALVSFRLRSPLVHMTGDGFVTTLPITEGPFRERLWLPVFDPARADSMDAASISLVVRWPVGAFDRIEVGGPTTVEAAIREGEEESSIEWAWTGDVRDVDLLLLAPAAEAAGADLPVRGAPALPGRVAGIERTDRRPGSVLGVGPRERPAVVDPFLRPAYHATQDFGAELEELLPLDHDLMDELFEESATDSERGADDRSAQ